MKQFIKRAQSLAFAVAMLLSVGVSAMPQSASAATTATSLTAVPRVTFTFDDGLTSSLDLAAPTLAKYGYTGTNYVITSCPGTTGTCKADPAASYMTWDQIKQLQAMGWNIGSHTQTHPYLASTGGDEQELLTAEQVDTELKQSKADIATNMSGYEALDFAAPYGDYNNTVLATAAKYYATLRGFADIGNNVYPYNDRLVVNQQVQEGTTGDATRVTLAMAKSYVDAAIAGNQWLTFTFHNITSTTPTSSDDYATSNTLLDQIAAYVKEKNVAVVSPHDAVVNGTTNMLGDGSFDNNTISTDWANRNTGALVNSWVSDDQTNSLIRKDAATNGSYVMGNATSPTNSLYISAGASAAHLWAPRVAVNPNTTYVVKGYFNILTMAPTATVLQPEVSYRVEEFDANGTKIGGDIYALGAVRYDTTNVNANNANKVRNANFAYKPSSASVAFARVYIDIQGGAGITGYLDNLEMFDPNGSTTTKAGDVNGDNAVDALDLSTVLSNWGKASQTKAQGDLNGDGAVDALDLSTVLSNWGK